MKKNYLIILALLLVFLSRNLIAVNEADKKEIRFAEKIKFIEKYIERSIKNGIIPGISIAFYKDDFIWTKSFGMADLENEIKVAPETKFRFASVLKPMTALAVVKLSEMGKLNLDEEVQEYVPYFPKKKWPLTIRNLLGMVSGMSNYENFKKEGFPTTQLNTRQAIDRFKDLPLEYKPGEKIQYSNHGYNLLGAVIEAASKMSYEEFMKKYIWHPLEMKNTLMDNRSRIIARRARGYDWIKGKILNTVLYDSSCHFASGGALSTALDLIKYARGLDNSKVLSLDAQKQMYKRYIINKKRYSHKGMGWNLGYRSGYFRLEHSGGTAGFSSYLFRLPREKFAVAILGNQGMAQVQKFGNFICSLIMDIQRIRAITPEPLIFNKMKAVWFEGLGYWNEHQKMKTVDNNEIKSGFEYFKMINSQNKNSEKLLRDGVGPETDQILVKMATYMVQRLDGSFNRDYLNNLRTMGPIPFFSAYIDLYKRSKSIPAEFKFSKKMEDLIKTWNISWSKTWTTQVRKLGNSHLSDLEGGDIFLKKIFKGQLVYPDMSGKLNSYAYFLREQGKLLEGYQVLKNAVEIYPENGNIFDSLGQFALETGEKQQAVVYYKKAIKINPKNKGAKEALEKLL